MLKVQEKVSGCFCTWVGVHVFARIRGYLSTLRKQDLPLLEAWRAILFGQLLLPSFLATRVVASALALLKTAHIG